MNLIVIALLIFVPMLIEAARARRNERAQKARGGIEPRDDVYNIMRVVYPAAFLAMLAERAVRPATAAASTAVVAIGVVLFAAAKIIKWSAILALGRCWTFRVIVVPGDTLVASGPYRYFRHPNYVGVIGELVGAALMTGARVAGPIAVVVFAILLQKRIAVEDRALGPAKMTK
jgi:methyltransferase